VGTPATLNVEKESSKHDLLRQKVTEWKLKRRHGRDVARAEYDLLECESFSAEELELNNESRPKTRSECCPGGSKYMRPCPWALCKFNMFGTLMTDGFQLKKGPPGYNDMAMPGPVTSPLDLPREMSCLLDMVEAHPAGYTLDQVGEILGLTRERIRQIQESSLRKARIALRGSEEGRQVIKTIEHLLSIEDEEVVVDVITPDCDPRNGI